MNHYHEDVLRPYMVRGNLLTRAGYVGLEMPWDEELTASAFERETFLRREWEARDVFSSYATRPLGGEGSPLERIEALMETGSPVTRWREAHPDLAGTDKDCVRVVVSQIREVLGDLKGSDAMAAMVDGAAIVVLCVKRAHNV